MRDYKLYIDDILESIQHIESFTNDIDYMQFVTNTEKLFAVKHRLLIVGEASNKIPQEIKNKYPQIEWQAIIGMRNRTVHEYFGLQLRLIWKIVKEDIPVLKNEIQKMLND